jgi:aquaporin Z
LFVGDWALEQLWLFWVAPIAGALLAGWLSRTLRTLLHAELEPAVTGK